MITVANRTETAARIKYAFDHRRVHIDELCDPARTLHIDSKALSEAEAAEEPIARLNGEREEESEDEEGVERKLTTKQKAELLRQQVDTVGQVGKHGEHIQNVVSVGMLSEG
jgi:type III restriction enzyme